MYNCKDEHLASISLSGDLILHNLASGTRAAELKHPNEEPYAVRRILDYSRTSRHLLVTSGDDGSVHLWDTTGHSPKISWLKKHSAPITGVSFSPSNDKTIASVGLDKKLYTFDSGSRRHSAYISYEAPFSSLAFKDDGYTLAAGTNSGQVVFYDLRVTDKRSSVLHPYGNSEDVTSLCWQRSKPVLVNENCTDETALVGAAREDSILMPDPLSSVTSSNASSYTAMAGSQNLGRSNLSLESSSSLTSSASMYNSLGSSTAEETPLRSSLWSGGNLARFPNYNNKDDMGVFSPLVDVQPITPSVDWKPSLTSIQDDSQSWPQFSSTPATSSNTDDSSSITPPEAWGGEQISDKLAYHRQSVNLPSRLATLASSSSLSLSSFGGSQDLAPSTIPTSISHLTSSSSTLINLHHRDISESDTPLVVPEQVALSPTLSLSTRSPTGQSNFDAVGPALTVSRRFSTYAERRSTNPAFSDGTSISTSSPKTKKTGAETREELINCFLLRSEAVPVIESVIPSSVNGGVSQSQRVSSQPDLQQGSSFTLQLFQRSLEETLAPIQKAFRDDMRNLHIEILRQTHMQQMEYLGTLNLILENQSEMMRRLKLMEIAVQQLQQSL